MVARQETHQGSGAAGEPPEFSAAVAAMRAAVLRPEIFCEEMPAPQRIAPFATALSADVTLDGDEVATGRIVLLHDPAGNDTWDGTFRCVAYCRAEIEHSLATDPMLTDVGWTWLTDALGAHNAGDTALSGTVTRVATESYGTMAADGGSAQLEVRASWTPTDAPELAAARRGLGRAAVYGGRPRAGARRSRGDAVATRTAGLHALMPDTPSRPTRPR